MKVLFITEQYPWPLHDGGNLRTWYVLEGLAREHEVWLASHRPNAPLDNVQSPERLSQLATVKKAAAGTRIAQNAASLNLLQYPLFVVKNWSGALLSRVDALLENERFDVLHFNHLDTACFVTKRHWPQAKVFDTHNCLSAMASQVARERTNFMRRKIYSREATKLRELERRVCQQMDTCLVCSEDDRQSFHSLCPQGNFTVAPNGVDTDYFKASGCYETEPGAIVFTGAMNYYPNEQAVLHFCKDVMPYLRNAGVPVRFYIVGKDPPRSVRSLHDGSTVIVTGQVRDVRPYVERAEVFVVPLKHGSGTRLKILEAFAMEKAVVSTTRGAEGIDARRNTEIVLADEPREFAEQLLRLLASSLLRRQLGAAARTFVESRYSWTIVQHVIADAYARLKQHPRQPAGVLQ